jgi:HSP20 family molecular chaperone IbpA
MNMTEQEIATKEKQQVQGQEKTRAGRFFLPEVDIQELNDSLKLFADMPGVKQSDVEVTLDKGILTIVGTVSTEVYQKLTPLYTEYNVGNYFRQFELNEDIDAQRINASMRDGVLELTLPKSERARPRRIEVNAR